jgi:hypothetical protein
VIENKEKDYPISVWINLIYYCMVKSVQVGSLLPKLSSDTLLLHKVDYEMVMQYVGCKKSQLKTTRSEAVKNIEKYISNLLKDHDWTINKNNSISLVINEECVTLAPFDNKSLYISYTPINIDKAKNSLAVLFGNLIVTSDEKIKLYYISKINPQLVDEKIVISSPVEKIKVGEGTYLSLFEIFNQNKDVFNDIKNGITNITISPDLKSFFKQINGTCSYSKAYSQWKAYSQKEQSNSPYCQDTKQ